MIRTFARLLCLALFALILPFGAEAKTFYWISHGSPADPVWTYFLAGANLWAKDTGQTVKTSFHNGDVPSQQEAIRAAIAAKADAIVTTSPDPGSLVDVVKEAEKAIATVFKPLNITWEVTDSTLDQANVISRMSDYLTANRKKIKAIIGLGDLVTGSIKRVFDQVGVKPGEIPVVGWGNSQDTTGEVMSGYVNAGMWQDPQATSYMALSVANMATDGIPPGFNITTGALYGKDTASIYDKILSGK
jgi:simple sugar transport system substrate-binding protein